MSFKVFAVIWGLLFRTLTPPPHGYTYTHSFKIATFIVLGFQEFTLIYNKNVSFGITLVSETYLTIKVLA